MSRYAVSLVVPLYQVHLIKIVVSVDAVDAVATAGELTGCPDELVRKMRQFKDLEALKRQLMYEGVLVEVEEIPNVN